MANLPDAFDEYEESRREGFLKIKELKEQGANIVGIFCTYSPLELIYAADAIPVSLCGVGNDTIQAAEIHLPKNLCPLIKSSYGNALMQSCPYFYFSDLVVGETTCDGKKKMYEILGELKDVHVMHLPQGQMRKHSFDYWKQEMLEFKEVLEKKFNVDITDEKLRQAIKERNRERKILLDFYELGKLNPTPISGYDINTTVEAIGFKFDKNEAYDEISKRTLELKEKYEKELKGKKSSRPRILITGCPTGGVRDKVIKQIEDLGADVVCFENCSGPKEKIDLVDETIDPIDALTQKYLNINCSIMTPNPNRLKALGEMIDEYQIDGVIEVILQACHTFNIESFNIRNFVKNEKNKPYLCIETDYSELDRGQLNTRFNAFIEIL
jgi:benzoyl-CoA reductase/2-hydroxyglutaryl-CoA dehydratase subunit BcrC/BadD/HgdB